MITEFSHFEYLEVQTENEVFQLPVWVTTDRAMGISFSVESVDTEMGPSDEFSKCMAEVLRRLSPQVLMRIDRTSKISKGEEIPKDVPRVKALKRYGLRSTKIILSLEIQSPFLSLKRAVSFLASVKGLSVKQKVKPDEKREKDLLREALGLLKSSGVPLKPLTESEINEMFPRDARNWSIEGSYIDQGDALTSCLRVGGLRDYFVSSRSAARIFSELPVPHRLSISMKRLSRNREELLLQKRISEIRHKSEKEKGSGLSLTSNSDSAEAIESLRRLSDGGGLIECEFVMELRRPSLEALKKDLWAARSKLYKIFDTKIETFGALSSVAGTLPGSSQHVTFIESADAIAEILPIYEEGQSTKNKLESATGLLLHRKSEAIEDFNIFHPENLNSNLLIVGKSGRGKSAFLGMLTESLLSDRNIEVIKVDVGGSHRQEVEIFGGRYFEISAESPSGLDPFLMMKKDVNESERATLLNFIETLMLESGERFVSKSDRQILDEILTEFFEKSAEKSLHSFIDFAQTRHPRGVLLRRFSKSGVYGKVFSQKYIERHSEIDKSPREAIWPVMPSHLTYYNLSKIFEAADPDLSMSVVAAVLSEFNLKVSEKTGKRTVLIFDETPFFIRDCFSFFKFTAANVRKFGAALVLSVQSSKDLIQQGDSGVIDNSHLRVLFSEDGDSEEFQKRFGLTDIQMESVRSLQTIKGEYSESFIQGGQKGFVSRLKLHPEELLRVTTSPGEREKTENLLRAVPGLTREEAIRCLSLT